MPPPKNLDVIYVGGESFSRKLTAASLQGLVNRRSPRVYLLFNEPLDSDYKWLETYISGYGLEVSYLKNLEEFVRKYVDIFQGFTIYDPQLLQSIPIAIMLSALDNTLIASPEDVDELMELSGKPIVNNFVGRWKNSLDAVEWSLKNLWPETNHNLVASMPLDRFPHVIQITDFLILKQPFTFMLSVLPDKDPEEFAMFDKVLSMCRGGYALGWSNREEWYVTLASKYDIKVLCTIGNSNLSIHSTFPCRISLKQHKLPSNYRIALREKIYVTFIYTDGDSPAVILTYYRKLWDDPARGLIPIGWGFQPYLLELSPGVIEYYYKTMTPNDYFLFGPSGAGYIYYTALSNKSRFSKETRDMSKLFDLEVTNLWLGLGPEKDSPPPTDEEIRDIVSPFIEETKPLGLFLRTPSKEKVVTGDDYYDPHRILLVKDTPVVVAPMYYVGDYERFKDVRKTLEYASLAEKKPLFLSLFISNYGLTPTELHNITKSLGSEYQVVRPDVFLHLLKEYLRQVGQTS